MKRRPPPSPVPSPNGALEDHRIYQPPYARRVYDGAGNELSVDEHRATTYDGEEASMHAVMREYGERGFWDREAAATNGPRYDEFRVKAERFRRLERERLTAWLDKAFESGSVGVEQYSAAILHWRDGLSYGQIARKLGKSKMTVRNQVHEVTKRARSGGWGSKRSAAR